MRRIAAALTGAVFILLIYLLVDGVAAQAWELSWTPGTLLVSAVFLTPVIAATLLALYFILRHEDEKYLSRVALAVVLFSLISRVIWISVFDSYQVNDFGYYLNCGADVALSGKPSDSQYCGPELGYVYWKRSAFYTYPLALLFGKSLLAVKLANVLLATLTAWIFFRAGKIILGAKVAAIGLLFFIWHPDLWYAMTLASHDYPGLFWLSVFFYLCALLQRRLLNPAPRFAPVLGLSLGVGGSIFFLEVSRSYHYGAILALLLYAIIHAYLLLTSGAGRANEVALFLRHRFGPETPIRLRLKVAAIHAVLLLVIPIAAYLTASRVFWRSFGVRLEPDESGLTCYLTTTDVFGESSYDEIDNWLAQCPMITRGERTAFAIRKVLHDVTNNPYQFVQYLIRKNRALSRADDYLNWSTSTEHESWDTTYTQVRRVNHSHLEEQEIVVYLAHAALLLLVAWRFLIYPTVPFRLSETIPILFSAVFYSMFLFLLETQSRYEVFLIFIFSWMAAQAVTDLHRRIARTWGTERVPVRSSRATIYCGGAFVLISAGCLFWGASHFVADSFLTLRDQSGFSQVTPAELEPSLRGSPHIAPVFVANNHKQLLLAYPTGIAVEAGSVMAVQRAFTVRRHATHHLRFFLSTYAARIEPYNLRKPWDDVPIEYIVAVNGRRVASGVLSDMDGNRYFSFSAQSRAEFGHKVTIQLLLRNLTCINKVDEDRGPIAALEYIDLQ